MSSRVNWDTDVGVHENIDSVSSYDVSEPSAVSVVNSMDIVPS